MIRVSSHSLLASTTFVTALALGCVFDPHGAVAPSGTAGSGGGAGGAGGAMGGAGTSGGGAGGITGAGGSTTGGGGTSTGTGGSIGTVTCDPSGPKCNNCGDDDGDGLADAADPECIGPFDNDEGTFATGIPGDNLDAFATRAAPPSAK